MSGMSTLFKIIFQEFSQEFWYEFVCENLAQVDV